jgi:hypothetical protein
MGAPYIYIYIYIYIYDISRLRVKKGDQWAKKCRREKKFEKNVGLFQKNI